MTKMLPYEIDYADYSTVYNSLSFVMASMMASTIYFFFHAHLVQVRPVLRLVRVRPARST